MIQMKKPFVFLACLSLLSISCREERLRVPEKVLTAFHKDYPEIKDLHWEMELGSFEAEFEMDGIDHSVVFSREGNWELTERSIPGSEFPKWILDTLPIMFPDHRLTETSILESPSKKTRYLAEVQWEGEIFDVLFNPDGTILKMEDKEDD